MYICTGVESVTLEINCSRMFFLTAAKLTASCVNDV